MSREKLEQAVYYIGGNRESAAAEKLREKLAKRTGKNAAQIPLVQFNPSVLKEAPAEIILLAHSDDKRQEIGDKTPKELIQDLARQFLEKDRTQLKSIKLVACEGGFGEHPLALEIAKELYEQGFTQAVVKSVTHPKESKVKGIISVTFRAAAFALPEVVEGRLIAIMYGNQKTVDYIRWKKLNFMRGRTTHPPEDWTESLEREMELLAVKNSYFRGFYERHPDYCVIKLASDIDHLDAPYNCYTKDGGSSSVEP